MKHNFKHLYVTRAVYPAQVGGPANTVYESARASDSILVLSSDRSMSSKDKERYSLKYDNINNVNGARVYLYKTFLNHPFSLQFIFAFINLFRSAEFVHLHSFFAPTSLVAAFICLIFNKRIIVHPHGELLPEALKFKSKFKFVFSKIYSLLYSRAHCFTVTSSDELEASKLFYSGDFIQIPNTINMESYQLSNSFGDYFLYMGRLDPIKNIELLLKSYKGYTDNCEQPLPLKIAGAGNSTYVYNLKSLVDELSLNKLVSFTGHVTGASKATLYKSCRALILVSKSENFGNVVLEALAYGRPVITSTSTPWGVTEENGSGIRVELSVASVKNALDSLSRINENIYSEMTLNAYTYARSQFDSVLVIPTYLNRVESL